MGTNFYVDGNHVGKRVNCGKGQTEFVFASRTCVFPDAKAMVSSDNGQEMTMAEFEQMVRNCNTVSTQGGEFC